LGKNVENINVPARVHAVMFVTVANRSKLINDFNSKLKNMGTNQFVCVIVETAAIRNCFTVAVYASTERNWFVPMSSTLN
jgi:hypothetical protein